MVSWWRPVPANRARLPHQALTSTPLPGLASTWSRLVEAKSPGGPHTFHVLDTGPVLAERGIKPTGTILALHGNPTWSYLWRGVIAASLERAEPGSAWRVIAPDQLDMGFSDRLAHPEPPAAGAPSYRRLEQRLDDLDALADALDIDTGQPLVTLGHDWGGIISLAWAVRHSSSVDAVSTLNTAVDHPSGEPVPPALRAAMAPGLLPAATVLTDAFLRTTLSLAEGGLDPHVSAAYRAPYVSRLGRGGIGGFVADIPALAQHSSRTALEEASAGLREWEKPALLIWGPKDPVFRDRYLHDLLDRLPGADLHRFEGAGHLVAEDRNISEVLFTWLHQKFQHDAAPAASSPPPAAEVMGLHQQLAQMAASWRRDSPAVVELKDSGASQLSWAQLQEQVEVLASGLHELGVRSGDRVSLLVQPGNQLTVILYACLRLGAVAVVADAGLGLRGLTRAVRSAWPDWVIGEKPGLAAAAALGWPGRRISVDALSPRAAAIAGVEASVQRLLRGGRSAQLDTVPMPAGEDQAAVLFTSGSTGPAKGVIYTHARLGALVALLRSTFSIQPGASLIAGFAPFALLGPAIGATSVTPDMTVTKPATLSAAAVAAAAREGRATMFFGSPAALANVVATAGELSEQQRQDLAGIRLVLSAGAPVHPQLLDRVQELFPTAELHTPYGMTEGLLQADITRPEIHQAMATGQPGVCVGRPVEGVVFALAPLDDLGRPAETLQDPQNVPGKLGEIVVSAAHLKAGYDRLWHTDLRSRRDRYRELLWHRTGDVGHFDAEGRLWVQGRVQHVITTPAGPVGPGVVETPVDALPQVRRSAAVGVGPAGTQAVVVVLEPASGAELGFGSSPLAQPEVSRQVREASSEVPVSAVLVVDRLPTDIRHNSKIDRTALAGWAEQVLAGRRVNTP
ncbi:alpha/beta fold hydrolase [Nesterenkonia alkaliphila]|uniref:Alpha/beta fold hydrolase n=1 Tax=Nesterenkonia alkaliphila TaxID=1463631 RepID=A0A7K1ULI9_9MICC|nr:alpha/beta fold hydrolase [Nesterenkonia alkaliphila]MVT27333.1 alpha/beta fold hydrolase [Nesterenkonia alkaliphila]GFZ80758.1 acyl-CoA synthetase [Nesterenkonia alkaliphila]